MEMELVKAKREECAGRLCCVASSPVTPINLIPNIGNLGMGCLHAYATIANETPLILQHNSKLILLTRYFHAPINEHLYKRAHIMLVAIEIGIIAQVCRIRLIFKDCLPIILYKFTQK